MGERVPFQQEIVTDKQTIPLPDLNRKNDCVLEKLVHGDGCALVLEQTERGDPALIGPLLHLSSYIGQLVCHVPIDSHLRVKSTRQYPNYAQNTISPDLEWILTIIGLSKKKISRKCLFPGHFTIKTRQEVL